MRKILAIGFLLFVAVGNGQIAILNDPIQLSGTPFGISLQSGFVAAGSGGGATAGALLHNSTGAELLNNATGATLLNNAP